MKSRVTLLYQNLATLKFSDFENPFFSGTLILRFFVNFGAQVTEFSRLHELKFWRIKVFKTLRRQ